MTIDITLIAAISEDYVIAVDDELPWRLPGDLKRFKRVTLKHAVIMGRKTLDTLPGVLSDRLNIVISRDPSRLPATVEGAGSIEDAIEIGRRHAEAHGQSRVFVAGGGEIYRAAVLLASEIDLTRVRTRLDGAKGPEGAGHGVVTFPRFEHAGFRMVSTRPSDRTSLVPPKHSHGLSFERWVRGI